MVAAAPAIGVVAGLITNLLTTKWSWALGAALIACVVVAGISAVVVETGGRVRNESAHVLSLIGRRFSFSELHDLAAKEFAAQMVQLIGDSNTGRFISDRKYIPEVFVERAALRQAFDNFLSQEHQVLAVVGDAGLGKTNLLCSEAIEIAREVPTLFYRGAALAGTIRERVLTDLGQNAEHSFAHLVQHLNGLLQAESKRFFIFIDAINEAPIERETLRADLNRLVEEISGSRIKLIVSCRTLDWSYWIRDSGGLLNSLGLACRWASEESYDIECAIALNVLSNQELDAAWSKYQQYFSLQGSPSERMRQLCREPFMLRLVAEVYRNGKVIPTYIHPLKLFERYLEEKFSPPSAYVNYYHFLHWLGMKMFDTGRPWVAVHEMELQREAVWRSLLDEHVIIFEREGRVQFHFELFMEFIVAQALMAKSPTETRESRLAVMQQLTESDFINAPGVTENLLLYWQDDTELFTRGLEYLVARADEGWDRWRTIACSVLRKADVSPSTLEPVVRILARDPNYVIRLFIAEVMGKDPATSEQGGIAYDLAADIDSWETRETAANVFAAARNSEPTALAQVWELANDYNWRVRRAAGYALHDLWETGTRSALSNRRQILTHSSEASWRQKYALCAALHGCNLDEDQDARTTVADRFTRDANPQVRWAVANYLHRYRYSRAATIWEGLAHDPDPWIRSRVATSVVAGSRHIKSPDAPGELLDLSRDKSSAVRVTVARELRWLPTSGWLEDVLQKLAGDTPPVAFAAVYTMHSIGLRRLDASARDNIKLVLRERVARCEMDASLARFAPVERYILRRSEFVPREDYFMRLIDSMSTIIASSTKVLDSLSSRIEFLRLLRRDEDESVRWALVVYLVEHLTNPEDRPEFLDILELLSRDRHWWIRREVAIGLGRHVAGSDADSARRILGAILARETASQEECSDEVMYFVDRSIAGLSGNLPA